MCGIVGYAGTDRAEKHLVDGLSRLEYRGYDSSGLATIDETQAVHLRRARGKLSALKGLLDNAPLRGHAGVGHTRWATHGPANVKNAHPHRAGRVTLVHNGIVENYLELRGRLQAEGVVFRSDTDTEVIAQLINSFVSAGLETTCAIDEAARRMKGAWAIAFIDHEEPERVYFARQGSPMVLGLASDGLLLASDANAISHETNEVVFLQDGDRGWISKEGVSILDVDHQPTFRIPVELDLAGFTMEKGLHPHYMHKEIHEQPQVVSRLLDSIDARGDQLRIPGVNLEMLTHIDRVTIVACGSSRYSGMLGKEYIERLARIPVDVELASEFRYRDPILSSRTLVIGVSQSGETADTLAALEEAIRRGANVMAVCNVPESAIDRLARGSVGTFQVKAGPEIGVASTKAFVAQSIALHLFALGLATRVSSPRGQQWREELAALRALPLKMGEILESEQLIRDVAARRITGTSAIFLGRGTLHSCALEAALKLKEISYIHAEGFAAGEMKHGPIALLDENVPVIALAGAGESTEKLLGNLEEAKARGAPVLLVADPSADELKGVTVDIPLPKSGALLAPMLATVAGQLLAYHCADLRNLDVDQPRNLAKSVTVE